MPRPAPPAFVVICGGPATGKSAAAAALAAALAAAGRNVAIVDDAGAAHAQPADAYRGRKNGKEEVAGRRRGVFQILTNPFAPFRHAL